MVKKVYRFWKVLIIDLVGVLFMIGAILTGWLPGPGGIPLFIIGLSLLAINHEWAQRLTDTAREYADRAGDIIFVKEPRVQAAYDVLTVVLFGLGGWLLWRHSAMWVTSMGISATCLGLVVLGGNRGRWERFTRRLKRKD